MHLWVGDWPRPTKMASRVQRTPARPVEPLVRAGIPMTILCITRPPVKPTRHAPRPDRPFGEGIFPERGEPREPRRMPYTAADLRLRSPRLGDRSLGVPDPPRDPGAPPARSDGLDIPQLSRLLLPEAVGALARGPERGGSGLGLPHPLRSEGVPRGPGRPAEALPGGDSAVGRDLPGCCARGPLPSSPRRGLGSPRAGPGPGPALAR